MSPEVINQLLAGATIPTEAEYFSRFPTLPKISELQSVVDDALGTQKAFGEPFLRATFLLQIIRDMYRNDRVRIGRYIKAVSDWLADDKFGAPPEPVMATDVLAPSINPVWTTVLYRIGLAAADVYRNRGWNMDHGTNTEVPASWFPEGATVPLGPVAAPQPSAGVVFGAVMRIGDILTYVDAADADQMPLGTKATPDIPGYVHNGVEHLKASGGMRTGYFTVADVMQYSLQVTPVPTSSGTGNG